MLSSHRCAKSNGEKTMTTTTTMTTKTRNRSEFSRERRSHARRRTRKGAFARKREIAMHEKTAARNREIGQRRWWRGERGEREKERLLATRVTHGARDNFARVTSSSRRRTASLLVEEETRFRFFRLMRLSRRISYGKTAKERTFAFVWKR